jgi:hypothetical protein
MGLRGWLQGRRLNPPTLANRKVRLRRISLLADGLADPLAANG